MACVGICDDLDSQRSALSDALKRQFARRGEPLRVVEYPSGEALLEDLEDGFEQFDLLFLDIYMSGITGVETARRVRKMGLNMPVVFVTVTSDYALESYDVDAAGYLLKPLQMDKLERLLDKLFAAGQPKRVPLQCGRQIRYVRPDEIVWAESRDHLSILHKQGGETLETRMKLDELERAIDDTRFLRCHQSFLINMDHVTNVDESFHMADGSVVPIRVRSRRQMADAFYRYFVSKV